MHRRVRVLGGPAARAGFGGSLSLPWLLLGMVLCNRRCAVNRWTVPMAGGMGDLGRQVH
jgi:hypothetical protein